MADPGRQSVTDPLQAWRSLVEKSLAGRDFSTLLSRTHDGVSVGPLYAPRSDVSPLAGRASERWTVVQTVDDPDPEQANEQALDDFKRGAGGLSLRFAGSPLAGGFGLTVAADTLSRVLEGVDLAAVALSIEPHRESKETARSLRDLVARRGLAPELTSISFGFDPISVSSFEGASGEPEADDFPKLVLALHGAQFRGPFMALDARPYHEAGATIAQQLGIILASAVWWLRAFERAGVAPARAIPLLGACLSVDRDAFASVGGIRALRLVWARLLEVCDLSQMHVPVHAESSRRMLVRADPHTNFLRATIAAFAAAVGGADSVSVLPHDAALGLPDRDARALACNIQHLLLEETDIRGVIDAAAGSGAIEALTESLAESGWTEFQQIEREGGIDVGLATGALQTRIASARDALMDSVVSGSAPLVGATVHRASDATLESARAVHASPSNGLAPIRLEDMAAAAS